jgi:hypothetical protein
MASTYLTRTPASSGSSSVLTYSFWTKRSGLGVLSPFLSGGNTGTVGQIVFSTSDQLNIYNGASVIATTNAKFRDTSAWYHIVISLNSSETGTDKCKIWINGVQETSFVTDNRSTFTTISQVNQSGIVQYVGSDTSGYVNGLMSHIHMVDGTAYDASTFGETDATTGIWKPNTSPSVTYGTNGFFLKFENSGSMGLDSSPNGNDFTVNGTLTQTVDTPSNVFATMNALNTSTSASLSYGNTKVSTTASGWYGSSSTLGFQKGFPAYWEAKCISSTRVYFGLSRLEDYDIITGNTTEGQSDLDYMWRLSTANEIYYRGSNVGATYSAVSTGDIISCKVDADGTVKFYKNDSLVHTFSTTLVDDYFYFPILSANAIGGGTEAMASNFGNGYFETTAVSSANSDAGGQGIFEYDNKSGYALNTKNINTYG